MNMPPRPPQEPVGPVGPPDEPRRSESVPPPHDPYWPQDETPPGPEQPGGFTPPPGYLTAGATDPSDPLYSVDIASWWQRSIEVFARSWRSIGVLMLIGVGIPSLIIGTVSSYTGSGYRVTDGYSWEIVSRSGVPLLLGLLLGYLTASAWAAALRAAAIEAAGDSVGFMESIRYGFSRGLALWGWGILAYLTIVVGLVLCVLPGLWALIALSLIAPVTVFERTNSYVRSIKLVHSGFGGALGRLAIAWLLTVVYACVVSLIAGVIIAAFDSGRDAGMPEVMAFVLTAIVQAIASLLMLIPSIWLVGAILCTYTGLRGRTEPVTAASLATEVDR
jgi:hypothetical protein